MLMPKDFFPVLSKATVKAKIKKQTKYFDYFFYIFIIGLSCCTTKRTSVQKATHVVCSDADYATILDFESFEDILHSDIFFFKYFYSLIVEDIHKKTMVQILAFDIEKPVFLHLMTMI